MLRSVSVFSRLPSSTFSRVQFAKMSVEAEPWRPRFIPVERSGMTSMSNAEGHRFSVVSYNILAQAYVKSEFFPHSPSACLRWKARSKAVLSLLKDLGTDFLCLQEVDEYDMFYKVNMERLGYSSIHIKRSGRKKDGCGIFYKDGSADLLLQETIEYNDLVNSVESNSKASECDSNVSRAEETETAEKENAFIEARKIGEYDNPSGSVQEGTEGDRGDPNDPRVRLKRDCVGIMGAFRLKGPSDLHIVIANTHLYWDPEWADVKLAQAKYLLSRLAQFKRTVSERLDCSPSVIVTGDFNSTPGDQVYRYLISGSSNSNSERTDEDLPIPLTSLYAHTRGEPPFTNCTPDFTNTLDYIFFSSSDPIEPVSFLELPEPDSPSVLGCLPNHHHPSDHLPIGAEFVI